jgi:predicted Fe-Mo cluster-binding NifX family protein
MKVAVTAQQHDLNSPVDPRFGRAQCIIVMDTDTEAHQVVDNAINLNIAQGAGIQTAKNVVDLGADAVITGNVGPKAFGVLSHARIKVFLSKDQTASEAVAALKDGTLEQLSQANVESHW